MRGIAEDAVASAGLGGSRVGRDRWERRDRGRTARRSVPTVRFMSDTHSIQIGKRRFSAGEASTADVIRLGGENAA